MSSNTEAITITKTGEAFNSWQGHLNDGSKWRVGIYVLMGQLYVRISHVHRKSAKLEMKVGNPGEGTEQMQNLVAQIEAGEIPPVIAGPVKQILPFM